MRLTVCLAFGTILFTAFGAYADCSKRPIKHSWNIHSSDQRISGDYVAKLVTGKRVRFGKTGSENYGADGSYFYQDSAGKYQAIGVKFYNDGSRCIHYANGPRYDLYVANAGQLVLINRGGGRFEGKVTK
ncbi:hypothetical protein [Tateyamaria sp. SN3-11]|uniref:hypothetical protein n=1 Tax=Tateyamaria sp. SN3-11 TaxID=3092147 RepID=UPI0039EAE0D5